LPEKFGLKVGNQYVVLTTDDVAPLRELIKEAREGGKEFVEFGEEKIRIPSTVEAEQSLSDLLGAMAPSPAPGKKADVPIEPSEEQSDQKHVLIVEENFDKLGFIRKIAPRKRATPSLPAAIRPRLMKHQQSGLDWMQETWVRGYAGALLADDMGLGKTLQALGFLAWLREVAAANRSFGGLKGPIIIVAPTGLLANWEKEHDNHLHDPGLGEICRAYGRHLKILKTVSTRDIDRGAPSLDHRRIQEASWVLTTYETLRDHHLSFASIPFSCAVFDEMQKVKSPSSLLTRAAKTRAGGVGLTLTSANHVIHLSRWWNPAVEDQCTDRVYRIGQDRTVHIYYPMAVHPLYGESSFDALLNALLTRKRDLSRRMLLPPVNIKQDQNWFADNLGRKVPEAVMSLPISRISMLWSRQHLSDGCSVAAPHLAGKRPGRRDRMMAAQMEFCGTRRPARALSSNANTRRMTIMPVVLKL